MKLRRRLIGKVDVGKASATASVLNMLEIGALIGLIILVLLGVVDSHIVKSSATQEKGSTRQVYGSQAFCVDGD